LQLRLDEKRLAVTKREAPLLIPLIQQAANAGVVDSDQTIYYVIGP
jgi:hypothetical protein